MELNEIKNSDFEVPIKRLTSPMTPWQVYELGLTVNKMLAKIFLLLAENTSDPKVVYNILIDNQIVADTLADRISLHRTNEMVDYYGSRGRIRHGIEGEVNQATFEKFDNDAGGLLRQFDRLLDTIKQKKSPFSTEEVWGLCTKITNHICEFYQAIIDIYPPGETNDAVKDIYNLAFNTYKAKLQ